VEGQDLRGFKCNENKKNLSETIRYGGRLYWGPRYTTDCSAVGGGRGGGEEEEEEGGGGGGGEEEG